jgi:hypothetical protein
MTMEPLIGRMSPRILWLLYALALSALATVFFAPLGDHLLDTHDGDYLLDSADSLADASFFFAADKRMFSGVVMLVCFTWRALCSMCWLLGYWLIPVGAYRRGCR